MCIVVLIHVVPDRLSPVVLEWSGLGAYRYVSELLSHVIGQSAVPCFFVLSGYFACVRGARFTEWPVYRSDLSKKLRTLALPYVIWAVLALVVVLGKQVAFARLGLEVKDALSVTPDRLGALLWSDVYNYPLWYLRDLLCMTLLLPLWSLVTRWGVLSVVALCVIYLIGGGVFRPQASRWSRAASSLWGASSGIGALTCWGGRIGCAGSSCRFSWVGSPCL